MSVEKVALVLNYSKSRGTDKVVLIGIANHEGDGGAWPSVATLARYANVDERSVQRSISNLVALGELDVERQAGGSEGVRSDRRPNRYRVLVRRPADGVTPVSSRDADGVTSVTPRGDARVADGVTPTSPEPSVEPSVEPEVLIPLPAVADQANAGTVVAAYCDEFRAVHGAEPPAQALARIGRDARLMLTKEGRDPEVVIAAAQEAARFGHPNLPSALTRVLAVNGGPQAKASGTRMYVEAAERLDRSEAALAASALKEIGA